MKWFIVEQIGYVQVEASRRFLVEVPDHITEEQAEELVVRGEVPICHEDGMEWTDDLDRKWVGCDVDVMETDIYESDGPDAEGLKAIKLEECSQEEREGVC